MGVTQRIKGQEVECLLMDGTTIVEAMKDCIQDFDLEFDIQILSDGFLGKKSDEYDEIFNGMKGSVSFQVRRKSVFAFILKIKDKAQRRTPGATFGFKATLNFPSGERARVLLPDIHFGPVPLSFKGRAAYGNVKVDFACSSVNVI